MSQSSSISRTEQEVYRNYERQRRFHMLGVITPAFITLVILALASVTAYFGMFYTGADKWIATLSFDGVLLGLIVCLSLALLAERRRLLNIATGIVVVASVLGFAGVQLYWDATQGFGGYSIIELSTFSVIIVLAGVLGNGWIIAVTTLCINALSTAVFLMAPRAPGAESLIARELPFMLPNLLISQWIFAAIMLAIWRTSQQSMGALGLAYERSRRLEDLKDQFISHVNHELRTPITALQMYIGTAYQTFATMTRQDLEMVLDQSNQLINSLVELVGSVLGSRRIDQTGTSTNEAVDLHNALRAAISLIDPREGGVTERPMHIFIPPGATIWGDRIKLQQILTNLLSNACKYSEDGTPIEVTTQVVMHDVPAPGRWKQTISRPMLEIVVRDYGLGIPADQIPVLFNRFVRLPRDLASRVQGNGLGLYLCRIYAEHMGGRIWVESDGIPGHGSAFHLVLPTSATQKEPAPVTAEASAGAGG